MNLFNGNKKDRPSKIDLLKAIDQHFNGCECEASTHTISTSVTVYDYVYDYTISRTVRPVKSRN